MRKIGCLLLTILLSLPACFPALQNSGSDSRLPDLSESGSSESESSSFDDSSESSSWDSSFDSSLEDSSSETEEENPAWAIVDALYALKAGESLPGTHTLTGRVTYVGKSGKKKVIFIEIEGREDKPVYCYGIVGDEVYALEIGDIATVSGALKNYKNEFFEFDNGCALDERIPADGSSDDFDDSSDGSSSDDGGSGDSVQPTDYPKSNEEAKARTAKYQLSGSTTVPDQAPTIAKNQPTSSGKLIRNTQMQYGENGKSYTVVDANGNDAFTVYRDGAYIALEEVAAFVYAFGTYPANYTTSKSTEPTESNWGEYLRLNHTRFSGDTDKYPYEPVLPNISGCGGRLTYWEMDVGTTGTDCDPSYPSRLYNNGKTITRGAARIVYGKTDLDGDGVFEQNEFHLFYTYNHYNDFQEYLNYYNGWGEMFGNITGGGSISSKYDYNPTDYVPVVFGSLSTTLIFEAKNYKAFLR